MELSRKYRWQHAARGRRHSLVLLYKILLFALLPVAHHSFASNPCARLASFSLLATSLDDSTDHHSNSNNNSNSDDEAQSLRTQFKEQQKQINALLKLVQQQQQQQPTSLPQNSQTDAESSSSFSSSTEQQQQPTSPRPLVLAPCKVMLFIDGTWLYYSLHERQDPMMQKYGIGWQHEYTIDWQALPRILCEHLDNPGWSSDAAQRPFEVVRASVFTSYKADTPEASWRYKMFQEMKAANYDVHMMETVGRGEKCVDIQLAVEMLHFATVPHAYDIALILTGDKDFMPAMIRTRQKGRKVGLVSMRRGCNRALFETPGVKDFDVIWLEDTLDRWIVPKASSQIGSLPFIYSAPFFIRILVDFCWHADFPRVSSRDLGRYLKFLQLSRSDEVSPSTCVLDELKRSSRGLMQFLKAHTDLFTVHKRSGISFKEDPSDKAYWISLRESIDPNFLPVPAEGWNKYEEAFFCRYNTEVLRKQQASAYAHTRLVLQGEGTRQQNVQLHEEIPADLARDYSKCTVKELRERCRERGLPVSGLKSALLERVQKDVEEQLAQMSPRTTPEFLAAKPESTQYLTDLVVEYVKASGGSASSRDVGRYLAANRASTTDSSGGATALTEVKSDFGSLQKLVMTNSDIFVKRDQPGEGRDYEFRIELRKNE